MVPWKSEHLELAVARLADHRLVRRPELGEAHRLGGLDRGHQQGARAVGLLEVDREAEVDVLGLELVGLAVDDLEAGVHLRHGLERLDDGPADEVRERHLAASRTSEVVVDHDAVVEQQLDRAPSARSSRSGRRGWRPCWRRCGRRRRAARRSRPRRVRSLGASAVLALGVAGGVAGVLGASATGGTGDGGSTCDGAAIWLCAGVTVAGSVLGAGGADDVGAVGAGLGAAGLAAGSAGSALAAGSAGRASRPVRPWRQVPAWRSCWPRRWPRCRWWRPRWPVPHHRRSGRTSPRWRRPMRDPAGIARTSLRRATGWCRNQGLNGLVRTRPQPRSPLPNCVLARVRKLPSTG